MIKYFSMFSGIGGFEYGMEKSRHEFECVGYSEIDKYARSIYERHYPNHINYGDATRIDTETLPDFDFLVGGFPCQAFSNAGKRRGFDDTRGTLFFEIARILKDKRPTYFLLENVRGLLSHNKGETFQTILKVLSDLGYDVKWSLYNSKDFGVPQRRERVFIKGYSRRECGGEVLLERGEYEKTDNKSKIIKLNKGFKQANTIYSPDGLSVALCGNGGGQGGKTGLYAIPDDFKEVDDGVFMTTTKEGDSYAITTRFRGRPLERKQDNYVLEECIGSTQKHSAKTDGSYAPTLTEAMGKGGGHVPMVKYKKEEVAEEEREIKTIGNIEGWGQGSEVYSDEGISPTLTACDYKRPVKIAEDNPTIRKVGNFSPNNHHGKNVYDSEGLSPTLCSGSVVKNGLNVLVEDEEKVLKVRETTKKGYKEAYPEDGVLLNRTGRKIAKGMVQKKSTGTLATHPNWGVVTNSYRVRRLTPRECERLQAFPDDWTRYGKDGEEISNTQRYKCIGNAVTTTVITAIMDEMFDEKS